MNKSILAIMIVALVGGTIVGMAMIGTINIPGITPQKKKQTAQSAYAGDKEGAAAGLYTADKDKQPKVETPVNPQPKPAPKPAAAAKPPAKKSEFVNDPEVGRKKVAKLWNEMSVDSLEKMIGQFKGSDLPQILAIMDQSKVAKVLEKMKADQAAKLSKQIQAVASKVKAPK